jgi:hypothetical protein
MMQHSKVAVAGFGKFAGCQMLKQRYLFSRNAAAVHAILSSLKRVVCVGV